MSEKIVVIGSNSFSGSHFVHHALTQESRVLGISRSAEPSIPFTPYHWKHGAGRGFSFEQFDLNQHTDEIANVIRAYKPDYVINFAAQRRASKNNKGIEEWYQTNFFSNTKLHDRLKHFSFLKKYVHVSTPEVYGTCQDPVVETQSFNPSTHHGASRAACEWHLNAIFKNDSFPVVFTRAANVYGPGQRTHRIIPRTILSILLGKKIPLHGKGHAVRSFIHVDDVVSGTLKAARQGTPGEAYHLSTSRFTSISDLVALICDRMNVTFENAVTIVEDRPGKDAAYLLDNTKSHRELYWSPNIELEDGIDSVIAWVQEWLPALKNHPFDFED
ncbi:MAG: GDP-mannose 4,6-dehydratase [Chthoniobacterales bacterium]|nr:GDP-mannose 4,6-dehydratase [Chthoniobacterales bacterium]